MNEALEARFGVIVLNERSEDSDSFLKLSDFQQVNMVLDSAVLFARRVLVDIE